MRARELPSETTGIDGIVQALLSVFDESDILALGESHWNRLDADLRLRLVRHPEFAKKVRFVVVEFASTAQQSVLDRYLRGESVPLDELQQVWRNTTQTNGVWESPVYADFFAAVRVVNASLPPALQIRVLAGDPPSRSTLDREASAVSVIRDQVLAKHEKALVVYGSLHLTRNGGMTKALEAAQGVRVFVVNTFGGPHPEYEAFERALTAPARPILVSVRVPPFRDLRAYPIIGRGTKKLSNGVWVDANPFGELNLSGVMDAAIYWGSAREADVLAEPIR